MTLVAREKASTFQGSRSSSPPSMASEAARSSMEDTAPGVFHTTVTERASFRTCRRQWYLENIELLEPRGSAAFPLIFGTVMHEALDVYYRSERDMTLTNEAFKLAWVVEDDRLARELGNLYSGGEGSVEFEWLEHQDKGLQMLKYYDRHDRESGFFEKIVDVGVGFDAWRQNVTVEERHFIQILDPSGGLLHALLSGRIDLIVKRKDGIWIIDHKNYVSAPSWRALEVDDQLTGYCFIWWRMTGKLPRGALYNVLLKDPPKPPRILTSGKLSTDKSQRTTYDLYMDSIQELGLPVDEYSEFLGFLEETKWSRFFPRSENVGRNIHQVENFGNHLYYEYLDMQRAIVDENLRYPNPTQTTCRMCSMVALCNAMEDGSDVEAVKESMYQKKQPRHEIPEEVLTGLRKEVDGKG